MALVISMNGSNCSINVECRHVSNRLECAPSELASVCHRVAIGLLGLPPPPVEPLCTRLVAEWEGASRCIAALWSGVGSASDSRKAEELPVVIDAAACRFHACVR